MNEWLPFIALAGLIVGLFAWLRMDIRELGQRFERLDVRIGNLEKEVAALKATVETYFRVRIDPPIQPTPGEHDQAA